MAKKKPEPEETPKPKAAKKTPALKIGEVVTRTLPLKELHPSPYNPRAISDAAWSALSTSISRFGLVEPIVWNSRTGNVVGGHQRLSVLEKNGAETATVVVVDLALAEEKALNLALNNPHSAGEFTDALGPLLTELNDYLGEAFTDLRLDALTEFLVKEPEPPTEFGEKDSDIETDFKCPSCGYTWSGDPAPGSDVEDEKEPAE